MFLFIAADKSVHIYALSATLALEFVCAFVGHTKGISDVNWSADSRYVCSASDDCTVMVWSVRSVCFMELANLFLLLRSVFYGRCSSNAKHAFTCAHRKDAFDCLQVTQALFLALHSTAEAPSLLQRRLTRAFDCGTLKTPAAFAHSPPTPIPFPRWLLAAMARCWQLALLTA